jgi:hypothetical protein
MTISDPAVDIPNLIKQEPDYFVAVYTMALA